MQNYANKNITGTTAGLAYNLGVAHGNINNAGTHNADPDGTGAADYDFTNVANFDNTVNNLTKFAHHTLLANDPVTDAA